jgi:hypothetical protein
MVSDVVLDCAKTVTVLEREEDLAPNQQRLVAGSSY